MKSNLSRLAAEMRSDVKALLVDNNPMVLAMFGDALTPLAKVAAAGALVKAYDSLPSTGAVFQVPGWEGGNFRINVAARTRHETTTLNTQGLLIEELRLLDEARRDAGGDCEEEEDVLLDS